MPLANLCNQPCCQKRAPCESTDSRATGSHPRVRHSMRAPRTPHLRADSETRHFTLASARDPRRLPVANSYPDLESRSGWCRRRELCPDCYVPARTNSLGSTARAVFSSSARSKPAPAYSAVDASPSQPSTDASCHAVWPSTERIRPIRRRRRPLSTTAHHCCRFPESKRLPPLSPSPPDEQCYLRSGAEGRHWYRGFCRPSPASGMLSRAGSRRLARPVAPSRLFTGARRATCRPSTSAIETIHEHTLRAFRTRWPCLRSDVQPAAASLGREEPAELPRIRGRPATNHRSDARSATARRADIPQLEFDSDTHMSRG